MPKICYQTVNFSSGSLLMIRQAIEILGEYAARAIVVTLRQLYYQFVARDLIMNRQSEYKRLGSVINDARLAGMIDWEYLQDRTRNLNNLPHWNDPSGVIESAAQSYHRDLWAGQPNHLEIWIEKDALVGVIETVCEEWDVPYFSCRGYTSQSEMWGASQRLLKSLCAGQRAHILHLGDHDPSGRDMSRDIADRLTMFLRHDLTATFQPERCKAKVGHSARAARRLDMDHLLQAPVEVHRIALNMDQVAKYSPPPNPAKITDSRAAAYMREFGHESWELDALAPDVLVDLIRDNILALLDRGLWDEQKERQEEERQLLTQTSENWPDVRAFVRDQFDEEP